jgi:hypothetical protein
MSEGASGLPFLRPGLLALLPVPGTLVPSPISR